MRPRVLLLLGAILTLCVLLLFLTPSHRKASSGGESGRVETTAATVPTTLPPKPSAAPRQDTHAGQTGAQPSSLARVSPPERSNDVEERMLASWQAPIDFYGKVVDENSNAVAGAAVVFNWNETPADEGQKILSMQSDTEGLFSLQGKRGASLVVQVSKDGYYASRHGRVALNYAFANENPDADPRRPVVFQLKKKGAAVPLVQTKRNYRIPRDGTPVGLDPVTGATSRDPRSGLVVQCWTDDRGKRPGQKYDWRCVLSVPQGGLLLSHEEFPFLAPETGYVASVEFTMPANRDDWRDQVDATFFYRLPDGRYGRGAFSMIAGGDHFCMVESFLNPSGSRNLEPK